MIENKEHFKVKKTQEKWFGITMSIFFILVGLYLFLKNSNLFHWPIILATLFFILAMFAPKYLKLLNFLWFKLGIFLSKILSPIIMFLIFFLILSPIAIITRIFKRDLINQNFEKTKKTYWINRKIPIGSMDKQF